MTERFMGKTVLKDIKTSDNRDAVLWEQRRDLLAKHLEYYKSIRHRF